MTALTMSSENVGGTGPFRKCPCEHACSRDSKGAVLVERQRTTLSRGTQVCTQSRSQAPYQQARPRRRFTAAGRQHDTDGSLRPSPVARDRELVHSFPLEAKRGFPQPLLLGASSSEESRGVQSPDTQTPPYTVMQLPCAHTHLCTHGLPSKAWSAARSQGGQRSPESYSAHGVRHKKKRGSFVYERRIRRTVWCSVSLAAVGTAGLLPPSSALAEAGPPRKQIRQQNTLTCTAQAHQYVHRRSHVHPETPHIRTHHGLLRLVLLRNGLMSGATTSFTSLFSRWT